MRNLLFVVIAASLLSCSRSAESNVEDHESLIRQFVEDIVDQPTYKNISSKGYLLYEIEANEEDLRLINLRLEKIRSKFADCQNYEVITLEEYKISQGQTIELNDEGEIQSYYILCEEITHGPIPVRDNKIASYRKNLRTGNMNFIP